MIFHAKGQKLLFNRTLPQLEPLHFFEIWQDNQNISSRMIQMQFKNYGRGVTMGQRIGLSFCDELKIRRYLFHLFFLWQGRPADPIITVPRVSIGKGGWAGLILLGNWCRPKPTLSAFLLLFYHFSYKGLPLNNLVGGQLRQCFPNVLKEGES